MSLSRPATFPLLKLPFLCIDCVIKSWDFFDIIFFALLSKRTRQIVKHLKIPLNRIQILLSEMIWIELGSSFITWYFKKSKTESLFDGFRNPKKYPLVLQNNAFPLYTSKTNNALYSYSDENEVTCLKMAMEFLNDVFKCSVEKIWIQDGSFPESGDIGVRSTLNLSLDNTYGYAPSQKLNLFLENLEITSTCDFWIANKETDFNCDPKLFKCKKLIFFSGSAAWVTWEILVQFEVPRLIFHEFQFPVEDIVSFVTQWFYSDNKKLEYLYIYIQSTQFSLEDFQTEELNSVTFSGSHRVPSTEPFRYIDFSKGLEIVRHDGLQATIHVTGRDFLFYIWHNQ